MSERAEGPLQIAERRYADAHGGAGEPDSRSAIEAYGVTDYAVLRNADGVLAVYSVTEGDADGPSVDEVPASDWPRELRDSA
ncbi:MAG: hypothetical protein JOZ07_06280 [Solirubrobacterales bacterium]|nr:hypothetical protein [Solirubrobacterales bacterium]